MNRMKSPWNIWLLGMDVYSRTVIEDVMGEGCLCRELDTMGEEDLAGILDMADREDPLMLWLGSGRWLALEKACPDLLEKMVILPVVLVMEEGLDKEVMERAMELPVQQIIRGPLTPSAVHGALGRALEARNLYQEMNRMAREISLGRELLERKSDVCSFLFSFFSIINDCTTARRVADGCMTAMADFCGLKGLHIAWWGHEATVHYILSSGIDPDSRHRCHAFMREQCGGYLSEQLDGDIIYRQGEGRALPENFIMLPLIIRNQPCGLLALDMDPPMLKSRDMSQALDAVRRHLALALWEGAANPMFFKDEESEAREPEEYASRPRAECRISG